MRELRVRSFMRKVSNQVAASVYEEETPSELQTVGEVKQREHDRAVLQYVVDNVPALIFWKDRNYVYSGCNASFAALNGATTRPCDIVGKTDYDMVWKNFADDYRAADRELLQRGEPILNKEELSPDGKGGEMVILTSKVPMRDESGQIVGVLGIIFDITKRKRMELELERAKQAAEQAASAKSAFLANVSHELRTPLTLILAPLRDALRESALAPDLRVLLERTERNALRLHDLVNDVLDFAKVEAGRMRPHRVLTDALDVTRAVVADMQPLAQTRGLALEVRSAAPSLPAALDPRLFERILLNLIGNALKFTPSGGWVHVTIDTDTDGEKLCLEVRDNGIGIAKTAQSRLFRPFEQVDSAATRKYEGTGLGLALVRHFAEAMEGTVSVDSDAGAGATFRVTLPLDAKTEEHRVEAEPDSVVDPDPRGPVARPAPSPVREQQHVGDGPRVLVAEDNFDLRAYMEELLRKAGFAVVAVENGRRAWEELHSHRFDALVSDVMMHEMDGIALTAKIKAYEPLAHLPVILVTARGGSDAAASGLEAGADDYVAKPFTAEELVARVRAAVRMARLQKELRDKSHGAGVAGVAADVLHNLGNALNSVNVSMTVLDGMVRRIRIDGVKKIGELLSESTANAATSPPEEDRIRHLSSLLEKLGDHLVAEQHATLEEIGDLHQKLRHVLGMVSRHNDIVGTTGVDELLAPNELLDRALRSSAACIEMEGIQVQWQLASTPLVRGDKHKILRILGNLLANARHALCASQQPERLLTIATEHEGAAVRIRVRDNGIGVGEDVMACLFTHGFTTKEHGNGLGLHTSALLAEELGGSLRCHSRGPDRGAEFILELPVARMDGGTAIGG